MTPKELMLQDFPALYPGLTRAGIEHVVGILSDPPRGRGSGLASELVAIAPVIATRLKALSDSRLDDYVDVMRRAAELVLQMWISDGTAPPSTAILVRIKAL